MKKLLFLVFASVSFVSCISWTSGNGMDDNKEGRSVTIYGNVSDAETGAPIEHALIQDENNMLGSTVTGQDGNYEFSFTTNMFTQYNYITLNVEKTHYNTAWRQIFINNQELIKVDFQLKPQK